MGIAVERTIVARSEYVVLIIVTVDTMIIITMMIVEMIIVSDNINSNSAAGVPPRPNLRTSVFRSTRPSQQWNISYGPWTWQSPMIKKDPTRPSFSLSVSTLLPQNRRRPYPSSSSSSCTARRNAPLRLPAPQSRPHRRPPVRHPILCRPQRPLPAPGRPPPPAVPPPVGVPLHPRLSRLQRKIGRWVGAGVRVQGGQRGLRGARGLFYGELGGAGVGHARDHHIHGCRWGGESERDGACPLEACVC